MLLINNICMNNSNSNILTVTCFVVQNQVSILEWLVLPYKVIPHKQQGPIPGNHPSIAITCSHTEKQTIC